ncbi:hypothetical protein IMZ48_17975 [Candidatus Bathyarchaeota archaeon]|nr:hypothetical protein [Candidatus Bathyarchaeota archaeon]
MQELQRRGLEGADDAEVLVGVDVGREAGAADARLQAVGEGGLGDALEGLARVAREEVLEGELVVPGAEDGGFNVGAAEEGGPFVLEDGDRFVDFLLGDAGGSYSGLGEAGVRVSGGSLSS